MKYKSYIVDNLLAGYDYVSFRSKHSDEGTQKEVLKELQGKNIDTSQLVELGQNNCWQAESSTT
jgi:hypothetical protein